MKFARIVAAAAAVALALVALTGCGGDSKGGSGSGSEATSTPPAISGATTTTAEPGKKVDTGPWTVVVKDVERGTKFGQHVADEGTLVFVTTKLTNNTDKLLPVIEKDFSLSNGENYTGPLDGDKNYTAKGMVAAGESGEFKAVFYVPPYIDDTKLMFVFQNAASGENVRIEAPLK